MKALFVLVAAMLMGACATPVLIKSGPQWSLKSRCDLMAKTVDWYGKTDPETKCGVSLEVILVRGGQ